MASPQITAKRVPIAITTLVWYTGCAGGVAALEGHQLVVQQLREFPQHVEIGARREAGVGDAVRAVQHQAAGSLEKLSFRLAMGQIHRARDMQPARA